MIDPKTWMPEILSRLDRAFADRLLYVGLQGSYRRGEAGETSDIDLVVVLDRLSQDDLDAYRAEVRAMPEGDKACGFICGRAELARWPCHELFQLKMDTDNHRGVLADFLPPPSRRDIREGARIGASGLYHLLAHSYLHAEPAERSAMLAGAFKGVFFVVQIVHYLRSGVYCTRKSQLHDCLSGEEKDIIAASLDLSSWLAGRSESEAYALLLGWCGSVLKTL